MIITCNNCNRKFTIDSKLIPVNGRLLECSKCNNQWFFKNESKEDPISNKNIDKKDLSDDNFLFDQNKKKKLKKEKQLLDVNKDNSSLVEEVINSDNLLNKDNSSLVEEVINSDKLLNKDKRSLGILNFTIVFIISFTALIIFIDTFKYPISKVLPDIEVILYNLYETIKDVLLFFKDLI